ncbi:hypothetical protein ERO13_A03G157300v2 [Gossypium hirsutum]|uniref:Uncharacterized protein n=3 Tax=Gossypium TaxID=3633 RepID=A0A5J5WI81_GOSBA|nr:hypothetical protein ES319_A03G170800v1 [Gossypium barbadense]KAG4208830.1 hypothetical protein ERO13_A03G157300v2 [Gossypium hirsutum]TYH25741.1 hypothetical protein ES288_A03G193700v1 [Gossypium darwinii]TYI37102.1 hypothetical protein ES332_A03G188200v1 [Gossypium tomentosum]
MLEGHAFSAQKPERRRPPLSLWTRSRRWRGAPIRVPRTIQVLEGQQRRARPVMAVEARAGRAEVTWCRA